MFFGRNGVMNSIVPSVKAGLDLEMPGPPRKRGKNLVDAVKKGFLEEDGMDANVRRVLQLVEFPILK
jgi:beta-glucosidase